MAMVDIPMLYMIFMMKWIIMDILVMEAQHKLDIQLKLHVLNVLVVIINMVMLAILLLVKYLEVLLTQLQ